MIAGALLAFVPELGTLTHGGVAAIVGVAPYAQGSGRMRGRRVCPDKRRGRAKGHSRPAFNGSRDRGHAKRQPIRNVLSTPAKRGKTQKSGPDCGDAKNRYNRECNRREISPYTTPKTLLLAGGCKAAAPNVNEPSDVQDRSAPTPAPFP